MHLFNGPEYLSLAFVLAVGLIGAPAKAEITLAVPVRAVKPVLPQGTVPREVQIVLFVVVDKDGIVESAVEASRSPADTPDIFTAVAVDAVKEAQFHPSQRDGRPIRSRVEYVVVFHPQIPEVIRETESPHQRPGARDKAAMNSASRAATTDEPDQDYAHEVTVESAWTSPHGLGDMRIKRELLEASPHVQGAELLSAAPGFFVDHEDGEGLGNDINLRGFDFNHGSGIELRVGSVPVNSPIHVQGQGYADLSFLIPEVVRSIRVIQGVYDPEQGDAAVAGSAYFDLGVPERGYRLKTSYGSFNQRRVLGIFAPRGEDEETFAAVAFRQTDGFGPGNRAGSSGSGTGQFASDLGHGTRLRIATSAYGTRSALAGVLRKDDLDAGRIGYFDSYPSAAGQSAASSRVHAEIDIDHSIANGGNLEFTAWGIRSDLRLRQNFTGSIETSQSSLTGTGLGDLWETTNRENAFGSTLRAQSGRLMPHREIELYVEPGVYLRTGQSDETRSLLQPATLTDWDRSLDAQVNTMDVGVYADIRVRLLHRLRLAGGIRADALYVSTLDRLVNTANSISTPSGPSKPRRVALGVPLSPRVTAEYELLPWILPSASYGEGFRSLDAQSIAEGSSHPYSKVRSAEAGFRVAVPGGRYTMTLAYFQTWVENELVFEAESRPPDIPLA